MSFMYLTCGMHNVQYVGETQQSLNARFRLHESMINTRKENPVANHFNKEDHSGNRWDYKIHIVGQESSKNRRIRLEESWMLLLNTHYPKLYYLEPTTKQYILDKIHHFGPKIGIKTNIYKQNSK